jgi:hypothetical protein
MPQHTIAMFRPDGAGGGQFPCPDGFVCKIASVTKREKPANELNTV